MTCERVVVGINRVAIFIQFVEYRDKQRRFKLTLLSDALSAKSGVSGILPVSTVQSDKEKKTYLL